MIAAKKVKFSTENSSTDGKAAKVEEHIQNAIASGSAVVEFVPENSAEDKAANNVLPSVDLPLDTTTQQLDNLLNNLLTLKEKTPFSFYLLPEKSLENKNDLDALEPQLLTTTLKDAISSKGIFSFEQTFKIQYKPLSLFKVHPACRLSSSLPGHTEPILHTSFSSKGHLATGGGDETVRFWDINTQTPDSTFNCHKSHVLSTAWSPDAEYFASGDKKGEIYIFSTNVKNKPDKVWEKGERGIGLLGTRSLRHKLFVSSLAFQPLKAKESLQKEVNGGNFSSVRQPNVAYLLSGSNDGTAKVWSVGPQWKGGKLVQTLAHHSQGVEDVKWSANNHIYLASRDKDISLWKFDPKIQSFVFSVLLKGHSHRVNSLALSTDYLNRIYIDGSANKYNLKYTKKNNSNLIEERLVSCSDDYTIFLWVNNKPLKRLFGHQQPVSQICFSPNGQFIASCSFDKKIKLWCGITGNFLSTFTGHVGAVYRIVFSADSALLASASKDSTVKIWAVKEKKAKHTLAEHYDQVYALDWSPERNMMASGGKDRLLRLWTA
eukprot:snap_masked-scaffold_1-processed-gene-31.28-mRNA-1 protein AED:0.03 eAED:0.03 QI:0/-1/0/1/-1/1/1/0/546